MGSLCMIYSNTALENILVPRCRSQEVVCCWSVAFLDYGFPGIFRHFLKPYVIVSSSVLDSVPLSLVASFDSIKVEIVFVLFR